MKLCLECENVYINEDWICPSCNHSPVANSGFPAFAPALAQGGAGFRPESFAKLADVEAKNFWFIARNRLIVWALRRHFPDMHRYLEIGCGTGYVLAGVTAAYPELSITGSDVFCVSLPFAANRVKHAELLQMDARQIPYKDEFDVIGAFDVLEHIEEDETVLSQMLQALLPGGGIAITVPQHMWLWSYQDEHACHVRRYSAKELRKKVINAGFKVEYETSFVCLLLPAMFISRIFQKRPSRQITHLSELRLPTLINCAFKGIMFIEHLLIRLGISLPLGGSLLMVATKI